jgi:Restriction endonuclease
LAAGGDGALNACDTPPPHLLDPTPRRHDLSMPTTPLQTRLDEISRLGRADARGRAFESVVADLFRHNHFDVRPNPRAARPRQTDLVATKVAEAYLIECKWRSDKATIDDLDTLRSRLRRTDRGMTGILVSMSGFTGTVVSDVGNHRSQPILLLSHDEIKALAATPDDLPLLLQRKKTALVTDGEVLLDEPPRTGARRRRAQDVPASTRQFMLTNGGERTSARIHRSNLVDHFPVMC